MDNRDIERIIIQFSNDRYPGETNAEFMETVVECRKKLVKLFAIPVVSNNEVAVCDYDGRNLKEGEYKICKYCWEELVKSQTDC